MNADDPLTNLRDIHLPPPVSVWPPAPGWWLLAAVLLITLIALLWLGLRWWRRRAYRRAALGELDALRAQWLQQHDDAQLRAELNALLKRVALRAYPRDRVAALHGVAWLAFLDAQLPKPVFAQPALQPLAQPYAPAATAVPGEILLQAARTWIRGHR